MCELDAETVFGWVRNRTSIAKQHLARQKETRGSCVITQDFVSPQGR